MMAGRSSSLLRLQKVLQASDASPEAAGLLDLLAFEVSQRRWTVPCAVVSHVMMPTDIIRLTGYPQLPAHVIGAVGTDTEMLSVVDAGLLLGPERTHASLKSRLVVFSDGALKGIALLVDRVLERASSAAPADASVEHLSPASLFSRIAARPHISKETQ